MTDAGSTNTQFYQTNMRPATWYKWFSEAGNKDDSGWTEVATGFARI